MQNTQDKTLQHKTASELAVIQNKLAKQKYPPILSAEEEYKLAIALYQNHDLVAAQKLILAHMRFVAFIAHGYKGYGLEQNDLIQEGAIGLMKSVKRFNPYKKVRLASFAVYWIRAEIHEFIFKNWKIVKIATTKAQRKLFFKLKNAKRQIYQSLSEKEASKIAQELDVRTQDVLEMESRLQFNDVGFNITDQNENDGHHAPEEYLKGESENPEVLLLDTDQKIKKRQALYKALNELDKRSLDILQSRYLKEEKQTLYILAKKYGISAERVRQLENNAMKKLKTNLAHQNI